MPEPLRPDFWAIVRPALGPTQAAGRAYISSGGYVEQADARTYRESDQGWPLVVAESSFTKGSPSRRSPFGATAGRFSKSLVKEVPALQEAMQAAAALAERDPTFARGLVFSDRVKDPERRVFYAEVEFLSIVGDILGRAEDLGVEGEEGLVDLYLQVERGRFATTLSGDVVVPLVLTTFDTTEPIQLIDGYWLEPLSESEQRSRALDRGADAVSPYIAAAATHAVVQRDVTFENTVWPPSFLRGTDQVPVPLDTVHRILESVHVVTGKKTGYAQVLVRAEGWVSDAGWVGDLPHLWQAQSTKAYPDSFEGGWLRPMEPISVAEVEELVEVAPALLKSPKNVQLAARRCFRSTFRADTEDEILDATIGIEALLSHGREELTHRMSQRAAAALAGELRADAVYQLLKQVYTQRSQIVHGSTPKNAKVMFGADEFWTNHIGVYLLRHLLRNYLRAEQPWTAASLDTLIIDRLGRVEVDESP